MTRMRRSLALLIPALALAAACTQSPTGVTKHPAVRMDGGIFYGSGNVVGGGVNTMGSGNAVDPGSSSGGTTAAAEDGGIFFGGGHAMDTGPNTTPVDSAGATERGGKH